MKIEFIVVPMAVIISVCAIGWAVNDYMRPDKDATGELNVSVVGSKFGSVGKGKIRWSKMIVEEIKPGGFVAVSYARDGSGGHYGAINPIDGVPDLAVGDWVRVEDRIYIGSDNGSESTTIQLITKKIE